MEIHHVDPNLILYPPTRKYMPLNQALRKTLSPCAGGVCARLNKQNKTFEFRKITLQFSFTLFIQFSFPKFGLPSSTCLCWAGSGVAVWRSLNIPKLSSSDLVSPHEAPNKNSDSVYQQKSFLNNFTISLSYTTSTK